MLVTTVSYTAQKQNFIIEAGKPTTYKARLSADNQSKPYRCNCYRQTFRLNELSPLMTGVKANNGMAAFTLRGVQWKQPFRWQFHNSEQYARKPVPMEPAAFTIQCRQNSNFARTRSQGVELTIQGNIKNFSIITGCAYNDQRLESNSTTGKKGDRYVSAPNHIADAWIKYSFSKRFLKGFGIGVDHRYVSDHVGNPI